MPKLHSSSGRMESEQEALLRATLAEYAPANVDIEKGRAAVAERLTSMRRQVQTSKRSGLHFLPRSGIDRTLWRKSPYGLLASAVVFVVVAVLLLGTGFVYLSTSSHGVSHANKQAGNPKQTNDQPLYIDQQIEVHHLYSNIGLRAQMNATWQESQIKAPVAITVTKVYAGKDYTVIHYDMQLPPGEAQRYDSVSIPSEQLTDQAKEDVQARDAPCTALSQDRKLIHCMMIFAPFHPAAHTSRLAVSWMVIQIALVSSSSPPDMEIVTGPWNFHFTVPFHSDDQDHPGSAPSSNIVPIG